MVKRAVLHGFGPQVQTGISYGTHNRFFAAISGMIVTMFLQSSTATALLASSFVGRGLMTVTAGLAVMIGADVGTALVAQILSFKITWLVPFLISAGVIAHLFWGEHGNKRRYFSRIILGLGFMLMALGIIREATIPMASSETLPLLLSPLETEPIIAILVAAIITYAMHSSVSAILLFATLAGSGILSLQLSLFFVIGANIGVGIIPLLAVMRDVPQAVQVPLGNLIMRLVMAIVAVYMMPYILLEIANLSPEPTQQLLLAHIGFNAAIACAFLPFIGTLSKLCARLNPSRSDKEERRSRPRYLDQKALSTPSLAMACATRETLHMAEILEQMLKDTYKALETHDEALIKRVHAEDDVLDHMFVAIKTYIIDLSREELRSNEAEQGMYIMNFATNLEHCGDIIEKSLIEIAAKKTRKKDNFSEEGLKEIKSFHNKVVKNLKLAQSIFLSSDPGLAKQLLGYKKGLKIAESKSSMKHMKRLRAGLPNTIATSSMHMDVIRDLRRINTYVTSVAYAILERDEHAK